QITQQPTVMKLYSTKNPHFEVDLKRAVLEGLPPDNGLYMPQEILPLPQDFFDRLPQLEFAELAFEVTRHLLSGAIPEPILQEIVEQTLSFDAPIHSLSSTLHVLELFHGPTLAFKDFGARFMARLMAYLIGEDSDPRRLTILVATSGDTGGAVANGFLGAPGIEVIILYPQGRVSPLQEKQLTALGQNITALEVEGSFDDCQALVKQAFLDEKLSGQLRLSSANSINIARLIPQIWYYFRAWQQLDHDQGPVAFCVPSGNFGNLTGGLMAKKMGLPIAHFIAATNDNDVVPAYLIEGIYRPRPSVATISNAMDVGSPSNFVRMQALHGDSWEQMRAAISGFHFDDQATRMAIREVHERFHYQIDPHGAVGYLAAKAFQRRQPDQQVVVLETAHPAKFPEVVEMETGQAVRIPERLAILADQEKVSVPMSKHFQDFSTWLSQKS
ncbi:MAG: threonine synthase, partial [Bacteroidota bacterium]